MYIFKKFINKQPVTFIWLLSIVGHLSLLPRDYYLGQVKPLSYHLGIFLGLSLICWLSYEILQKVDLKPFEIKDFKKQIIYPTLLFGTILGLISSILTIIVLRKTGQSLIMLPTWVDLLALLNSINFEVLHRLFPIPLVYLALNKIFNNNTEKNRSYLIWASIIIVSLFFGIIKDFMNIVLGWLFCRKGFWTSLLTLVLANLITLAILSFYSLYF